MSTAQIPTRADAPFQPLARLADIALPPEVLAELDRFDFPPDSRRQVERDYKLSYRFGGGYVVVHETPEGDEVIAAGNAGTVASQTEAFPEDRRAGLTIFMYREPWANILRDLGLRRKRRWWRLWLS